MADKLSSATAGAAVAASGVTTSGSIAANYVNVYFDDATSLSVVMDLLERAKCQIMTYYMTR